METYARHRVPQKRRFPTMGRGSAIPAVLCVLPVQEQSIIAQRASPAMQITVVSVFLSAPSLW